MRTIETKAYKFDELSEEAKQTAINEFVNNPIDNSFIYDEAHNTVKKFHEIFGTSEGNRSWLDFNVNSVDDNLLELKGQRLRTYILNNFGDSLFTPKFIGSLKTNNYVTHKRIKSPKEVNSIGNRFNPYYSGVQKDNCCVLTGVCYDDSLLQPMYEFLEGKLRPDYDKYQDFENLINDCFESLKNDIDSEESAMMEDDYIIDHIEANEYEFTEDGIQI